jgi:hypothetical protein
VTVGDIPAEDGKIVNLFLHCTFCRGEIPIEQENFETVLISFDSGECLGIGSGHRMLTPPPAL